MCYTIVCMNNDAVEICELLLNVISEFYENDNKARTFGTDVELYHSEIHTLQCIADNPGLHISALARILGVTRGAVSQTVKRLERKHMIVKEISPDNYRKVFIRLTPKGEIAVANHREAHAKYTEIIRSIIKDADVNQREFLYDFLLKFEKALRKE